MSLRALKNEISRCDICREHLPLGPRPVVQFSSKSRIVVIGQAPGTKVHETGIPWDDPSGDHLREWLSVPRDSFYDPDSFALVPMGFCYPGKAKSGDAPPRPECAPQWHERVLGKIAPAPLVLLAGQYAQRHYLGLSRKKTLTETVRSFKEYGAETIPLPHPSWRSRIWMKKNPWFESTLLPVLRRRVKKRLAD
ncbi:MAG: uracil-DNA glycosylase family protein [Polyangiales bacterium]